MAERSFPFATGAGSTVGELDWATMARYWSASGVVPSAWAQQTNSQFAALEVTPGTGLQVAVAPGAAWVQGHYYENTAVLTLGLAAADPAMPRIDRIVLRVDWGTDTVRAAVLTGTPGTIVPPGLTQAWGSVWEEPLAQVRVPPGATQIQAGDITLERLWALAPRPVRLPARSPGANELTLPEFALLTTARQFQVPVQGTGGTAQAISAAPAGTELDLVWESGTHTFVPHGALVLAAPWTMSASNPVLRLVRTATAWVEVGRTLPVPGDGMVTTPKLADGAVTSAKIANGAIQTAHLANLAVTTLKLAPFAVTSLQLGALDHVRVYRATALTIPDATATVVPWEAAEFDNGALWDGPPNPTRVTVKRDGWYLIVGTVVWSSNVTGFRLLELWTEQRTRVGIQVLYIGFSHPYGPGHQASALVRLAAFDKVYMLVRQDSGAPLDALAATQLSLIHLGL